MRKKRPTPRGALTAAAVIIMAGLVASCTGSGPRIAPGGQGTGTLPNGTTWVANLPQSWNGTLVLYSHGYGSFTAADAPDSKTKAALLADGYALAGSSYDPHGSEWALDTAVSDQFGALAAVEAALPRPPAHVLAFGTSMGGLVSALEAQDGQGKIDGALTTCGVVGGGVNLTEYQIDGEYAITQLLGDPNTQLVGLSGDGPVTTAMELNADAQQAQQTPAGQARLALAMAFLNLPAWDPNSYQPAPAYDPAAEEAAQYAALMAPAGNVLDFIQDSRASFEQAAGGQVASTAGTDFTQVLAASPDMQEVEALYAAAGLNLQSDLENLTTHATIKASPAAVKALAASSDPTGRLAVPELDLHTIGDNLVPVGNESYYAQQVEQASSGDLLRQAYTESFGHCYFSPAELVAGVKAVMHRVTTGNWGDVASAVSLEQAAEATGLGPAHFTDYQPGELTGAVPSR